MWANWFGWSSGGKLVRAQKQKRLFWNNAKKKKMSAAEER